MDSPCQDCEDEFFESLQDIPSKSGSESSEEDGASIRQLGQMQINMRRVENGKTRCTFGNARYEIWKNDPGTIPERRHRLLIDMGLERQKGGGDGGQMPFSPSTTLPHSSFDKSAKFPNLSTAQVLLDSCSPKRCHRANSENDGYGYVNNVGTTSSAGNEAVHCSIAHPKSVSGFSRVQQGSKGDGSIRLAGPCPSSPLLSQGGVAYDRVMEKSGSVLRSVSLHSDSNPPVSVIKTVEASLKSRSVNSSNCSSVPSHSSKSNNAIAMNPNEALPIDSIRDCVEIETLMRTGRQELPVQDKREGNDLMRDGVFNKEQVCRIKNLDSGKEFIVHELGRDGSWNKLKELDTGRELTLQEFENTLGLSPIVQEVMRRERAVADDGIMKSSIAESTRPQNKKRWWLKTIKGVVRKSTEPNDQGIHGRGNSISNHGAIGYIRESPPVTGKRIKVHAHRKPVKEFSELHMQQEFQAHQGAIWAMKFSLDGRYLASAGQDRIVCIWEVIEQQAGAGYSPDIQGQNGLINGNTEMKLQKRSKGYTRKKNTQIYTRRPSKLFLLSQKPKCLFQGHTQDILDLSWSKSQFLLSSSMDKTVRLWHISCMECLRIFKHHDYVTCIQFNPVADNYFISGSLDGKVRIWSVQDHRVVDWVDLSEMVTAACYTPDGQGAAVGSYKGTCRFYNASGNKLLLKAHVNVQSRKGKKSQGKKITGFQFISEDGQKVLITSSDSRIRVYDGPEIICKYKGFRNTKSQISASFSQDRRYIICASEDSRVYIWSCGNFSALNYTGQQKEKSVSYEAFHSQNVLVAIPWPGMETCDDVGGCALLWKSFQSSMEDSGSSERHAIDGSKSPLQAFNCQLDLDVGSRTISFHDSLQLKETTLFTHSPENRAKFFANGLQEGEMVTTIITKTHSENMFLASNSDAAHGSGSETSVGSASVIDSYLEDNSEESIFCRSTSQQASVHSFFSESRGSATWPEEQLPPDIRVSPSTDDLEGTKNTVPNGLNSDKNSPAWGLAIVTAGLGGEIRTFQNYSFHIEL